MKFLYPLLVVLLIATPLQTHAKTSYQYFMSIAEQAGQQGDFNTALINYGRAYREKPRDPEINTAVSKLLEERLQSLEGSNPEYVRNVRVADRAFYKGDYDTAMINYTRALNEKAGDYYAGVRIQQATCIKAEQPKTLAQFEVMCPSLYPSQD